jgi:hypothetical protein
MPTARRRGKSWEYPPHPTRLTICDDCGMK